MSEPGANGAGGPSQEPLRVVKTTRSELLELKRRLRALPAKKRLDAILERPDVMRVVRSLPVQDVLLTVREVGATDCLELLELLSPRQVQGILDLDAWRKDRIDPGSFAEWLELLYAANPARAVRQIKELDVELLSLLFKMHTRIYDLKEEEDPPEEPKIHSITPDHRYLIVYDESDGKLAHSLRQTVERLFGVDMPFVLRLVEAVRWEMPSALEEEAFRWRNGRMADLGFLPPGEAQEVFQYVDPDKALASLLREAEGEEEEAEPGAPEIVVGEPPEESVRDLSTSVLLPEDLFDEGQGVLQAALAQVSERRRRRFSHEVMMLGNRLHIAAGGDAGDGEALRATVKRAANSIGIALSYAAKGEPARLGAPLSKLHALKLFQIGHSLAVRVSRELRARTKAERSGLDGEGLLRLDSPLREMAAGLLRPHPLFFAGLADPARSDYQPFSSLHELAMAAKAVAEAAFRAELLVRGLEADDVHLERLGILDAATGPSHAQLLAAWLARLVLDEEPSLAPLTAGELTRLKSRLDAGRFAAGDEARAIDALSALATRLAPLAGAVTADDAAERAAAWARRVLAALAAELSALTDDEVEPRFVETAFTTAQLTERAPKDEGEGASPLGDAEEREENE